MVRTMCAVRDCKSSSHRNKELRFHQFPRTNERCKSWIEVCGRPDLVGRSSESLKNMYICSLHFEKSMYRKKYLKKISIPTLLLPTKDTVHTQTHPIDNILCDDNLDVALLHSIFKRKIFEDCEVAGSSSQIAKKESTVSVDVSSQTPAPLTDYTPGEKRPRTQLYNISNELKCVNETCEHVTEEHFLRACDQYLPPKLCAIVKVQLYLKPHCKNNRYSREFKLFCLNMYYTSPLAYRFLSKTICLPSKSTLTRMYLPMQTKHNQQIWDILTSTVQHMSSSQTECVLCMDEISLKLNLSHYISEDKILGLHEIDGQQKPVPARYAFTLMLRGITSNWKQPVGFSFISSSKIDDQLKTCIIATTKRLLQLGFNVRAFVSNPGSDFLALAKSLGISKENSCFNIDGHIIYYIFDVPHLIECVRNNLLSYDYEFDNKIARWEDIKNMYELDRIKDMRAAPRLTGAHIQPNSFQKRKVRFAVQVFSNTVVAALNIYQSSGSLQVAHGTICFIETMNNLFDLLNSSSFDSPKLYNKPYRGSTAQEELLDKSQQLFNRMRIKNKNNGQDVTNRIKFINAFNVTINSIRQLYKKMRSEGYDYIFTRRINNDCLENFFGLVRQADGNCRKPTCIQYTRAFRKIFLCHILNLSDSTNCTEDFDIILTKFAEFAKNTVRPQVSVQNPPQTPKENLNKEYDIPEKNVFDYICGYLLRRCVENHQRDCLSIVNYASSYADEATEKKLYIRLRAYETSRDSFGRLQVPPEDFVDYIHRLETKFMSIFTFTGNNIKLKLFEHLSLVEFTNKPCACFPVDFLLKLFIRMRIFYVIKFNNRNFKSNQSTNRKYLSVAHL